MDITEQLRDANFCRFPSSNMALRDEAAVEIESLRGQLDHYQRRSESGESLSDALDMADEMTNLRELLYKALQWTDSDKPLPEDGAICDAHPLVTGDYALYMEAMRIVGAKRSKGALVDVVNWLLHRVLDEKSKQITGYHGDEHPVYEQGAPTHELEDLMKADEANGMIKRIRKLMPVVQATIRLDEVIKDDGCSTELLGALADVSKSVREYKEIL